MQGGGYPSVAGCTHPRWSFLTFTEEAGPDTEDDEGPPVAEGAP
jgi:hypothetical protein